ncbi:histone acetyltransferase KAT5-like [Centruroides sculpturatus]|uniref:histone acetyltransferase KAT5-like n=1 Tax=Centruroides sculpturatus TaxID=218467 RepID=UPI000C6CDD16|nr:histone acetyltransferase KAT5-like [Centruroides sculpturatus]
MECGEVTAEALAEVLSIKTTKDGELYYIHYIDFNKRLDEWVTKDRLDLKKIQLPKKETKTPVKDGKTESRPSSPERELVVGPPRIPSSIYTEQPVVNNRSPSVLYVDQNVVGVTLAEVLSIKTTKDGELYYIHYIDFNKRLDEWVTKDRLDLKKIQLPKKETKTPVKDGKTESRPSSPERELVNGSAPPKKSTGGGGGGGGRKRKFASLDEDSQENTPSPRITGSLVAHRSVM